MMNVDNVLTRWIAPILVGLFISISGYAEEAPDENPPANQSAEELTPPQEVKPEEPTAAEATTPDVENTVRYTADGATEKPPAPPEEPKNFRDQQLSDRIKTLVKRFDAHQRKGMQYPSPVVEAAMRAEFMRRTEGGEGAVWMKKRSREADKEVALDNLELLVTYAEKLSWAPTKKNSDADAAKDQFDVKLLAVKSVIDKCNAKKQSGRGIASTEGFASTRGLSAAGKSEAARRKLLTAGQVAGDDYAPITAKKFDDLTKKYRQNLTTAVAEYEKLAKLVAGGSVSGSSAPAKKATKKGRKAKASAE